MLDPVQKRKLKNIIYHKITILCLFFVVLYALYSTFSVAVKHAESERLLSISLEQLEKLEQRHSEIQNRIDSLETTTGLEAEIRSRFNMAKAGENLAIVITEDTQELPQKTEILPWWQRVWMWWK